VRISGATVERGWDGRTISELPAACHRPALAPGRRRDTLVSCGVATTQLQGNSQKSKEELVVAHSNEMVDRRAIFRCQKLFGFCGLCRCSEDIGIYRASDPLDSSRAGHKLPECPTAPCKYPLVFRSPDKEVFEEEPQKALISSKFARSEICRFTHCLSCWCHPKHP
jgi:hypothetical protein